MLWCRVWVPVVSLPPAQGDTAGAVRPPMPTYLKLTISSDDEVFIIVFGGIIGLVIFWWVMTNRCNAALGEAGGAEPDASQSGGIWPPTPLGRVGRASE